MSIDFPVIKLITASMAILDAIMASMKSLFLCPFIVYWIENYPDVFLQTDVGIIVLFFTFLLYFHVMPLSYALFLLSLCVLQLPCDIQPNFREFIPPSVLSLLDATFREADPTGRISSMSRSLSNDEEFLVLRYLAVVLLVACFARFYGLFPCLSLFLVSLHIYLCIRDSVNHPAEDPQKAECEEMSSNSINGSIPSVEKYEGVEKDGFKEQASYSNSEVYYGPALSKKFHLEPFLSSLPLVEDDGISISDTSSDDWFHIERDGMDSGGDVGEINSCPDEDRYRYEQLMKALHPRLLRNRSICISNGSRTIIIGFVLLVLSFFTGH